MIRGQKRITKLICQQIGWKNKRNLDQCIENRKMNVSISNETPNLSLFSFSCSKDITSQCLSIFSFLHYAGTPQKWIIYSDGSYTDADIELFNYYFDFVEVVNWNVHSNPYPKYEENISYYINNFTFGKKFYVTLTHPIVKTNHLYVDADVIFYKKIADYIPTLTQTKDNMYMCDAYYRTLDKFYLEQVEKIRFMYQINAGMLLFSHRPNWGAGLEYLDSLKRDYKHFTEQTMTHITMHQDQAVPLDPRTFMLSVDDEYHFSTSTQPDEIAVRHYVYPLRHKFWQKKIDWHLR